MWGSQNIPDSKFFFSPFKFRMPALKLHPADTEFLSERVGHVKRPLGCYTASQPARQLGPVAGRWRQAAPKMTNTVTYPAAGNRLTRGGETHLPSTQGNIPVWASEPCTGPEGGQQAASAAYLYCSDWWEP